MPTERDALIRQCVTEASRRASIPSASSELSDTKVHVLQAFRKLDYVGDGFVERNAFMQVFSAILPSWSEANIDAMLVASGAEASADDAAGLAGRRTSDAQVRQHVRYQAFVDWFFLSCPGTAADQEAPKVSGPPVLQPISAEDLVTSLGNMAQAWESATPDQRPPPKAAVSFFDDTANRATMCAQMCQRWHSGRSSHPGRERLAEYYSNDEAGYAKLLEDVLSIRTHPSVQAADQRLYRAKYGVEPPVGPGDAPPSPVGKLIGELKQANEEVCAQRLTEISTDDLCRLMSSLGCPGAEDLSRQLSLNMT